MHAHQRHFCFTLYVGLNFLSVTSVLMCIRFSMMHTCALLQYITLRLFNNFTDAAWLPWIYAVVNIVIFVHCVSVLLYAYKEWLDGVVVRASDGQTCDREIVSLTPSWCISG